MSPTRRSALGLTLGIVVLAAPPAFGCEPILPLFQVVAGPYYLAGSAIALGLLVAIKAIAFASLERRLSWFRAATFMVLANVLSTIVGILVAISFAMPVLLPIWLPVIWFLSRPPARRLLVALGDRRPKRLGPGGVASLVVLLLVASLFLFGAGQGAAVRHELGLYWALKLAYVWCALAISIFLTTFWEEHVVFALASKHDPTATSYAVAAIRANLLVFLIAASAGAWMMLPERLRAPEHLVELARGWWA